MKRNLVASLAAASTNTFQMPVSGKLKRIGLSMVTAAAGSVEFSTSSTSQIATAVPDSGVFARLRIGATAGNIFAEFAPDKPVKQLDYIYVHTTGAGNVGEVTFDIA